MEDIHGVDVSWLHTPNRDRTQRTIHAATAPSASPSASPAAAAPPKAQHPPQKPQQQPQQNGAVTNVANRPAALSTVNINGALATPPRTPSPGGLKTGGRRPNLLGRQPSQEKVSQAQGNSAPPKIPSRKGSWLSSIGSKLGSAQPAKAQNGSPQTPTTPAHDATHEKHDARTPPAVEEAEPCLPPQSKSGASFFSAFRRLSTNSQTGGPKIVPNGGLCPRKVLNVDPNRPRCLVPELGQNKLRRVAFCVDVEIAGGPKYTDEADEEERKKRFAEQKANEKGEGEALKHPKAAAAEETVQNGGPVGATANGIQADPDAPLAMSDADVNRKKEKKKKSEEERKQRQEAKRLKAVESGQVPLQLTRGDSSDSVSSKAAPLKSPTSTKSQNRPTTDPLRMYRRCCQLRESGVLKRVSEQLVKPSVCPIATPGVVAQLDMTGSRMQLADIATLGDWLAIVPVKKLILEDSDLTDEGVRVLLAGLLAATKSDHPKLQRHRDSKGNAKIYPERAGVVEKLVLKNNPKITKDGWKHVSLFVYMCKSLKALDISMVAFPPSPVPGDVQAIDPAEVFEKSLSERLGGGTLEELVMAECNLTAHHIRRIVDGSIFSGVKRLGLAGNNIDDKGFQHILRYVRSAECHAIDLAGNDMTKERIAGLANAMHKNSKLWAISLADCNLTPDSLTPLFDGAVILPNLRFLDLSHNHALFEQSPSAIQLLQQNLPLLPILKRLHLIDVSLTSPQAIALAEILPECSQLAHLNILENPQLTALASASTDEAQEEACALYASLMVAARCSPAIVAIDIDVPSADNSDVVKALARQVIAYCLRNMEYAASFDNLDRLEAIDQFKQQHDEVTPTEMPEVLLHLLGESPEGQHDQHLDIPAPDKDYIVGGTGVVKALTYMLSEKAPSVQSQVDPNKEPLSPRGPKVEPQVAAAKAKAMSKDLLESARNIRKTLMPAMVREATKADDMACRRLLFLDNTLQNIIQRFEAEYPECKPVTAGTTGETNTDDVDTLSLASSSGTAETAVSQLPGSTAATTPAISITNSHTLNAADDESDDDNYRPRLRSRHNSDVSLAARALAQEEGQIHKLGVGFSKKYAQATTSHRPKSQAEEDAVPQHIKVLRDKLSVIDAEELRQSIINVGVEKTLEGLTEKAERLKEMEEKEPEELERVRQMLREKISQQEGTAA